eukprot:1157186-Pelagomonas_calceolata.AAC.12
MSTSVHLSTSRPKSVRVHTLAKGTNLRGKEFACAAWVVALTGALDEQSHLVLLIVRVDLLQLSPIALQLVRDCKQQQQQQQQQCVCVHESICINNALQLHMQQQRNTMRQGPGLA